MFARIWHELVWRILRLLIAILFLVVLGLIGIGTWFAAAEWRQAAAHHAVWWVQALAAAKTIGLLFAAIFIAAQPVIAFLARGKSAFARRDHGPVPPR